MNGRGGDRVRQRGVAGGERGAIGGAVAATVRFVPRQSLIRVLGEQREIDEPDGRVAEGVGGRVHRDDHHLIVQRGAPDSAFETRKHDADALRLRFVSCADGVPFARGLPEVAVRDPINKSSADLPPVLRTILDNTEVGHLTPPEQTSEGIQMFAVCSKKESKTDAPGLKEVRDKMFEKKFGAKANRYLAELRRQAMIEYKQ